MQIHLIYISFIEYPGNFALTKTATSIFRWNVHDIPINIYLKILFFLLRLSRYCHISQLNFLFLENFIFYGECWREIVENILKIDYNRMFVEVLKYLKGVRWEIRLEFVSFGWQGYWYYQHLVGTASTLCLVPSVSTGFISNCLRSLKKMRGGASSTDLKILTQLI